MSKKLVLLLVASISCILMLVFAYCESRELIETSPYLLFKKNEPKNIDTVIKIKTLFLKPTIRPIQAKTVFTNEWLIFKSNSEKQISKNEKQLQKIKENPSSASNTSLNRKIANLQSSNNDLRLEIIKYNKEGNQKRDNFKSKVNSDINKIEAEVKALVLNNK